MTPSGPRTLFTPLVLLSHQAQEPDEDVDEVQVDRDCRVDRVVQRVGQANRSVQVEDHETPEDEQSRPVEYRHGTVDRHAEGAHQRNDEVPADQEEQRAEQRRPPRRQIVRDEGADQPEHRDHHAGEREDLDDRRRLVHGDHGTEHEPERPSHEGVPEGRNQRVVARRGDDGAADGHHQNGEHEAEKRPGAPRGDWPVLADGRRESADDDAHRSPPAHQQHVELSAERGCGIAVLATPYIVVEHVPPSGSVWK